MIRKGTSSRYERTRARKDSTKTWNNSNRKGFHDVEKPHAEKFIKFEESHKRKLQYLKICTQEITP
jgi:hypothetical protein